MFIALGSLFVKRFLGCKNKKNCVCVCICNIKSTKPKRFQNKKVKNKEKKKKKKKKKRKNETNYYNFIIFCCCIYAFLHRKYCKYQVIHYYKLKGREAKRKTNER